MSLSIRSLSLSLIAFAVSYAVIEATSWLVYRVYYEEPFSFRAVAEQRERLLPQDSIAARKGSSQPVRNHPGIANRIIHPYTGFIHPPETRLRDLSTKWMFTEEECVTNRHGFLGAEDLLKKTDNTLNILIAGGSVANQFYCMSRRTLEAYLKEDPRLRSKEFHFLGLAISAHRQPQQLLSLTYYTALGGEFDYVINIDGYNEINHMRKVTEQKIYPAYPLHWPEFTAIHKTPEILKQIGRIAIYRERRSDFASFFNPFGFSVTAGLVWSLLDGYIDRQVQKANEILDEMEAKSGQHVFRTHGPDIVIDQPLRFGADMWYRTSLQMAGLARQNGAQYFHFLQPNQYVDDSKPLSALEKRRFMEAGSQRHAAISKGYPMLRQLGGKLKDNDVAFFDLSFVFKETTESIYVDNCCHINKPGNEIIAREIASAIRGAL